MKPEPVPTTPSTETRVNCPPELNQDTGAEWARGAVTPAVTPGSAVVLDFSQTRQIDSRGGAWILAVAAQVQAAQATLRLEGQAGHVADFLRLLEPALVPLPAKAAHPETVFEQIGHAALRGWEEARAVAHLLVDAFYWTVFAPVEGRGFRRESFVDELYEMGVRALGITLLMNFLLGLTIAMMSAAQLRAVGLDLYVADLVMIAFARELAGIMTAVVVSARTGAAIAAEFATMTVQEELDALRGMGLNVTQFLVVPKLLALLVVMPCLTLGGMVAGVLGGTVWGTGVLDFKASVWWTQTLTAATVGDIGQGVFKSFFFAASIVLIGCHNGLRVQGGSRGVGLMTTRAVVMDIFAIVVLDMLFAAVFYYVLG